MIASGVVCIFNCFLIGEIREHKLSEHFIPVTTAELVSAEMSDYRLSSCGWICHLSNKDLCDTFNPDVLIVSISWLTYLSIMTGSDGVSFLFPQDFFSQHRLEIKRWFFLFIIHRWRDSWNIDKGKLHLAGYKMCLMRFEWTSLEWPSNKSNKRLAKKLMGNISCCWGGKVYWS